VPARELLAAHRDDIVGKLVARAPVVARPSQTARAVVELMARSDVGRIVLVAETDPTKTIGIITRSDVVAAFAKAKTPKNAPEGI
jgi:CIC family chloride channel protein